MSEEKTEEVIKKAPVKIYNYKDMILIEKENKDSAFGKQTLSIKRTQPNTIFAYTKRNTLGKQVTLGKRKN